MKVYQMTDGLVHAACLASGEVKGVEMLVSDLEPEEVCERCSESLLLEPEEVELDEEDLV